MVSLTNFQILKVVRDPLFITYANVLFGLTLIDFELQAGLKRWT